MYAQIPSQTPEPPDPQRAGTEKSGRRGQADPSVPVSVDGV
jgi:hypothetical protein